MGTENLLGEPLTNFSASRLAAVFQRISRVVDQAAKLDNSLAASSTAITNEMDFLCNSLQTLARELAHVEVTIEKIVEAKSAILDVALAEHISSNVIQAISKTLAPQLSKIELRLQRVEQHCNVLSAAMVPWWQKLWNVIAYR